MKLYRSMKEIKQFISNNELIFTEDVKLAFDVIDPNLQIDADYSVFFLKDCNVRSLKIGGSLTVGGSLKVDNYMQVSGSVNIGESKAESWWITAESL